MSRKPGPPLLPAAFRRVDRINEVARRGYVPRPYPGRVTFFRAKERSVGDEEDVRSTWGQVAAGGIEIYEVPGNHDTFHVQEANVRILAGQLRACLRRAQAGGQEVEGTAR